MQKWDRESVEQVIAHIHTYDNLFTREDLMAYANSAGLLLSPFELDRIVLWMKEAGAVKEQNSAFRYVRFTKI